MTNAAQSVAPPEVKLFQTVSILSSDFKQGKI